MNGTVDQGMLSSHFRLRLCQIISYGSGRNFCLHILFLLTTTTWSSPKMTGSFSGIWRHIEWVLQVSGNSGWTQVRHECTDCAQRNTHEWYAEGVVTRDHFLPKCWRGCHQRPIFTSVTPKTSGKKFTWQKIETHVIVIMRTLTNNQVTLNIFH